MLTKTGDIDYLQRCLEDHCWLLNTQVRKYVNNEVLELSFTLASLHQKPEGLWVK
jgi:hypothetical protein